MGQESLNRAPWAGHQFYCIETVWIPKQIRAGWLDSAALNTAAQLSEVLASRVNHDSLFFIGGNCFSLVFLTIYIARIQNLFFPPEIYFLICIYILDFGLPFNYSMMTLCSTVLINIVKQLNILGTSVIKSTLLNCSCTLLVFITGGLHNNFNNMDCVGLKNVALLREELAGTALSTWDVATVALLICTDLLQGLLKHKLLKNFWAFSIVLCNFTRCCISELTSIQLRHRTASQFCYPNLLDFSQYYS